MKRFLYQKKALRNLLKIKFKSFKIKQIVEHFELLFKVFPHFCNAVRMFHSNVRKYRMQNIEKYSEQSSLNVHLSWSKNRFSKLNLSPQISRNKAKE